MPKAILNGADSYVELTIETQFIKLYKLEEIAAQHPWLALKFGPLPESGHIIYPFSFPPYHVFHSEEYIQKFVNELVTLLPLQIDKERHLDHLLFLAYTLPFSSDKHLLKKSYDNQFAGRAKLLLDLIKVPFPVITEENIFEYVENEDELLTYLHVLSGYQPLDSFLSEDKKINLGKIGKSLWRKLNDRLHLDKNITVPLDKNKMLILSKDITLKFHDRKSEKTFEPLTSCYTYQNMHLVSLVAKELITEQQKYGTEFYKKLIQYCAVSNDFREMERATYIDKKTFYTANLYKLYTVLERYLSDNSLFKSNKLSVTKRLRNHFIYKYFCLLGLLLKDHHPAPIMDKRPLDETIDTYKELLQNKPSFANRYFSSNLFKDVKPL